MKILIAEDDLISQKLLAGLLEKFGHEVVAASNGREALAEAQKTDAPKLVIVDWMMPEMDGLEVCHRLRAIKSHQPPYLIMLTSRDRKEDIVAGLEAGANDYLAKPYNPEELRARVGVGLRVLDIQAQLAEKIAELQDAMSHIKVLRGIVPICSHCKKIRDDKGFWNQVEIYISQHSEAHFSHGLCPDCIQIYFPEIGDKL